MLRKLFLIFFAALAGLLLIVSATAAVFAQTTEEGGGSSGLQGRISAPPPETGATISVPSSGQVFTSVPITVSGICPNDLLVRIFKNNVFAGAVECTNGSYSLVVDLFSGQNELVARVYDDLDQPGPDSNRVTVTFNDPRTGAVSRPTLTTNFAKRGANPGEELIWPIVLTGGTGPYALSVDWGDGKEPDLFTVQAPGPFDISHVYDTPGVYNIIVKATDSNDATAYLQLVGIGNGQVTQEEDESDSEAQTEVRTVIVWQPVAFILPCMVLAFWLGRRNQMKELRKKIANGERPF